MAPVKVMYLDEAGNHSLRVIESRFPVFALGGVILERDYMTEVIEPRLQQLKIDHFGRADFILHTADIARNRGAFTSLKDSGRKNAFLDSLTQLMNELDYVVVACVVRKPQYLQFQPYPVEDLYPTTLEVLVEQFCEEIGDQSTAGLIYAERRRPDLDAELELAWDALTRNGSSRRSAESISSRFLELVLKDKKTMNAGLQLADLVVSPIGRMIADYPSRADWTVIEKKFRRSEGDYFGTGLTVLP